MRRSKEIESACLGLANITMWQEPARPESEIIEFHKQLTVRAHQAIDDFKTLGATEKDIVNAIEYIAQVYAIPPIENDLLWFGMTLNILLMAAFPNQSVNGNAAEYAKTLIAGLAEQIESQAA